MAPLFTGLKLGGFGKNPDVTSSTIASGPITATGFDITFTSGIESWGILNSTSPTTITFSRGFSAANNVEILVVAGGGAGGSIPWGASGGGGAGGLIFIPSSVGPTILNSAGPYDFRSGAGASYPGNSAGLPGGTPSYIDSPSGTLLSAVGGGPGPSPAASPNNVGQNGGSGGGNQFAQSRPPSAAGTQPSQPGNSGTYGYGNPGGGGNSPSPLTGGGGGGAGSAGGDGPNGVGGSGFAVPTPFLPLSVPAPVVTALGNIPTSSPAWQYFAGGGAAGRRSTSSLSGGIGGGGNGSFAPPTPGATPATAGVDGRGGGGGGSSEDNGTGNGAKGGNGVIIVHWTNVN